MYFNRQILEIATMKSKISLATTETELEQWDQVVYWLVITGKNSQMNKTKEKQWLFVWETIKIFYETTGFARRGVPRYVVLFNTSNNSTRETKTKDEEVVEPRPHRKKLVNEQNEKNTDTDYVLFNTSKNSRNESEKMYIFQLPRSFNNQKLLVKPRRGQAADCTI